MSKREEFITFINELKMVSSTISDEQRKGLLRRAVQQHDISVDEAVEILQSSGLVIGEQVDYFKVLGLSSAEFEDQSESDIANRVEAAHNKLYRESLSAGGRVRPDGKSEEQWRTILNQARDTLIDPQKRNQHNVELGSSEPEESSANVFLSSRTAVIKPQIQVKDAVLSTHEGAVYSVAFSPDGATVASGSADKTVCMWDVATAEHKNTLIAHEDIVSSVTYSPDGSTIASASYDRTIRLWDAVTGDLKNILKGHTNWISSVAYSNDGSTIASGSYDWTVRLWDAITCQYKFSLTGHEQSISSVVYSPDDKTIASTTLYGQVRLWEPATGEPKNFLAGHLSWFNTIVYSPNGATLACGSYYGLVRLWDPVTAKFKNTLTGHKSLVKSLAYSPDGGALASCSTDKDVRLWNLVLDSQLS
jgi:predicted NACHT family NTPase